MYISRFTDRNRLQNVSGISLRNCICILQLVLDFIGLFNFIIFETLFLPIPDFNIHIAVSGPCTVTLLW